MKSINQKPLKGQTFYKIESSEDVEKLDLAFEKSEFGYSFRLIDDCFSYPPSFSQKIEEKDAKKIIGAINEFYGINKPKTT